MARKRSHGISVARHLLGNGSPSASTASACKCATSTRLQRTLHGSQRCIVWKNVPYMALSTPVYKLCKALCTPRKRKRTKSSPRSRTVSNSFNACAPRESDVDVHASSKCHRPCARQLLADFCFRILNETDSLVRKERRVGVFQPMEFANGKSWTSGTDCGPRNPEDNYGGQRNGNLCFASMHKNCACGETRNPKSAQAFRNPLCLA